MAASTFTTGSIISSSTGNSSTPVGATPASAVCLSPRPRGRLFAAVLLALRGKPTPFLHVYHHASTLALCWSQILSESCMQWLVMLINLFVHVVMVVFPSSARKRLKCSVFFFRQYAYFAMHAAGIRVWWKRYLTMLQVLPLFFSAPHRPFCRFCNLWSCCCRARLHSRSASRAKSSAFLASRWSVALMVFGPPHAAVLPCDAALCVFAVSRVLRGRLLWHVHPRQLPLSLYRTLQAELPNGTRETRLAL